MKHPQPHHFDHTQAVETHMADRYLQNKLTAEESQWFENHFPTCDACIDALEQAEALKEVVLQTAKESNQATVIPIHAKTKKLHWLGLGIAAGLLIGLLLPLFFETSQPIDGISTFVLISQRSSAPEPEMIHFKSDDREVSLVFPVPPSEHGYQIVLFDQANKPIQKVAMKPSSQAYNSIILRKKFFAPGIYRLDVEALDQNQKATIYSQHQFQIAHSP